MTIQEIIKKSALLDARQVPEHMMILGLIRSYYEYDADDFKHRCREVIDYFYGLGKSDLAEYIMVLIGDTPIFCPQNKVE